MIAQRRVAIAVTVVATGVFVLLAALFVPWSPVPGGTPDPVPVRDVLTSTEVARAEQFTGVLRRWGWAATAVNLLVVVLLALSTRVRHWAGRLPGPWWVRVLLAVAGVELAARVATLTFSVLSRRHVRAAGLSDQAWTGFARDLVVAEALDIVAEACAKVEKKTITSRVSIQRRLASEHTRNDSAQNDSSKTEG